MCPWGEENSAYAPPGWWEYAVACWPAAGCEYATCGIYATYSMKKGYELKRASSHTVSLNNCANSIK